MALVSATSVMFLLASVAADPAPSARVSQERIDRAVRLMVEYFWNIQDPQTGKWDHGSYNNGQHRGGLTALVTAALIAGGESFQNPKLARSIDYLRFCDMQGTYARATRAHVWSGLPDSFSSDLNGDARWLMNAIAPDFTFNYTPGLPGGDRSNTHFGVLGLWESAKRGVMVNPRIWKGIEDQFMLTQNRGGWGYHMSSSPTRSMTAAGLTLLLIVRQQAYRMEQRSPRELDRAISDAIGWLDEAFSVESMQNDKAWLYYYLFALERAALASGIRRFNNLDWFETAAEMILHEQIDRPGTLIHGSMPGGPVDTAFALLFLSRGRVPLWATKLQIPGKNWNNRPNDLNFLTRYLSDMREGEMAWQTLGFDAPLEDFLDTPLLYIASDQALELSGHDKQLLKRYLDHGGTLLANPDFGSGTFSRDIRNLALELYPQWPLQQLGPGDPLFTSLHHVNPGAQPVYGVWNGTRHLIILTSRDWGFLWQSGRYQNVSPDWKLIANLWRLVCGGGEMPGRAQRRVEWLANREADGDLLVGRLRHFGNWDTEPGMFTYAARHLFNRAGRRLLVEPIDAGELTPDRPLVHLAGTAPVIFSNADLQSLIAYARGGGTVLVESIGGRGGFARTLEADLQRMAPHGARQIDLDHPIISGRQLRGGYDNASVRFRRFTSLRMSPGNRPRLAAFHIDDRPAIIISDEDLSMGVMRCPTWGVFGYESRSAMQLMTNILLWSSQQRPAVNVLPTTDSMISAGTRGISSGE